MQPISGDIIIILAGTLFLLCIFGFIFFFVIAYNKRYMQNEEEKREIVKRFEVEKLTAQVEIQEQTLRYISKEIHDNIGQLLSFVSVQLSVIPTTDEEKVASTANMLDRAIQDLRNISKSMDSERIGAIGIIEAVKHDLEVLEKTGKYATTFTVASDLVALSADKTIILYRTVQEIMNNIVKHAKATEISFYAWGTENENFLTIADNGIGFKIGEGKADGLGLKNIAKRASLIGGKATIESTKNVGTTITLSIPKK